MTAPTVRRSALEVIAILGVVVAVAAAWNRIACRIAGCCP